MASAQEMDSQVWRHCHHQRKQGHRYSSDVCVCSLYVSVCVLHWLQTLCMRQWGIKFRGASIRLVVCTALIDWLIIPSLPYAGKTLQSSEGTWPFLRSQWWVEMSIVSHNPPPPPLVGLMSGSTSTLLSNSPPKRAISPIKSSPLRKSRRPSSASIMSPVGLTLPTSSSCHSPLMQVSSSLSSIVCTYSTLFFIA